MNQVSEYDFIASEITTLESLLAVIPSEDVIDRMSLESRLTRAKSVLATLPEPVRLPTICLTFRGREVAGSRSISTDFGTQALGAFSEDWLDKPVVANLHTMQIGRGKPRYILKSLGDLSPQ